MTKRTIVITSFTLLLLGFIFTKPANAETTREFRGVWVATVDNIDWPSRKGLPVDEQKKEMIEILDRVTTLHMNAIVFQVRPEGDALYDSKIEPWSKYITGKQGQAPEPYYDPLQFTIDEAHKRCVEVHAWLNPYRASVNSQDYLAPNQISKTHPEAVYKYGRMLWMDPGQTEIRQQLLNVISDLVKRYDLDGIHFDDYFYPYPEARNPFPDAKTYTQYTATGGKLAIEDWRRENVNTMVKDVDEVIKKQKPWVKFGISPFGIWQPGHPEGISGLNSYNALYADARKWLQEGWVDYLTPQLYWRILQTKQSYPKLLKWWVEQNTLKHHIYAGNYTSRAGEGSRGWPANEIIDQIDLTRQEGGLGNIHFSMKVFMRNSSTLNDLLLRDSYKGPAIVPAMPWLGNKAPNKPNEVAAQLKELTKVQVSWKAAEDASVWHWAVYKKTAKSDWKLITVLPNNQNSFVDSYNGTNIEKYSYAVTALDRLANESEKTEVALSD